MTIKSPTTRTSSTHRPGGWSPIEFVVLLLFFGSGASALMYEVVWSRQLTYVFGGSAFAIATVLAAFMAGLALGSTWFGRRIDRRGHPLVVYGLLEGSIAVWALLLPLLLTLLEGVYGSLYRAFDLGFYPLSLVRFTLCFLVLLVPTTMMGGTLPVLGKLLLRDRSRLGTRAGVLYGVNTIGAVLGVCVAGFVLVPALGLRGTTFVAVAINLLIMVLALLVSRRVPLSPHSATSGAEPEPAQGPSPSLGRALLFVYAASGFAALSYEVVWTKVLSMILGTTTYAFTSMLATFLLGLSLGALIVGRLADRFRRPVVWLLLVQLAIPLSAVLTIPLLERLPQIFVSNFESVSGSWVSIELFRIGLAAMTMFLPTLLMGATFPLVTRAYVDTRRMGQSLGRLYASNTIGAILGSFLTGFVFIPWLGRQNSILLATLVNLVAAVVIWRQLGWRPVPAVPRAIAVVLAAALIPSALLGFKPWDPIIINSGAYYRPRALATTPTIQEYLTDERLIFSKESTEAMVSVWRTGPTTFLRINGKVDASSRGDMVTQKMLAHLPSLYRGGRDMEAMVIGLASGITAGSLLNYPVRQLDAVELVEPVKEAARYFAPFNFDALDNPRLNLIINDGRNQLRLSPKKYDLISSEPPNPWIAGVGALFTTEFFELTKSRLVPGGISCQWLHTYHLRESELRAILATYIDVFPYVHLWQGNVADLLLIGGNEPLHIDSGFLTEQLAGPVGRDLAKSELAPLANFMSYFLTDREEIIKYLDGETSRVTDDYPLLEYATPRHMYDLEGHVSPLVLAKFTKSPVLVLDPAPQDSALSEEIDRYQEGNLLALGAHFNASTPEGNRDFENAYRRALAKAPELWFARHNLSQRINELGIRALQAGQIEPARTFFFRALAVGSRAEQALSRLNLGYTHFIADDLDSSRVYWEAAYEDEPFSPVVSFNLGLLEIRTGNNDAAIEYFRHSVENDPQEASAMANLAYLLAIKKTGLDEAEDAARTAVDLKPSSANRRILAYVLVEKGREQEALPILRKVMIEEPDELEGLFYLGRAEIGAGESETGRGRLQGLTAAGDSALARRAREFLNSL